MRRNMVMAAVILATGMFPSSAVAKRNLQATVPRRGAAVLKLDNSVGDVTVRVSKDQDLHVAVQLIPRRAGFFFSMKAAERQVEAARIGIGRHGRRITLKIAGVSEDPRFEANWTVEFPPGMDLEVDLGVGDLTVEGATGKIEADLGVGDAVLAATPTELEVNVGVGDIRVQAPASAFASIECSTGVGEVSLKHDGTTRGGEGMISKELSWKGNGPGTAGLDTGVGTVEVILTDTPAPRTS